MLSLEVNKTQRPTTSKCTSKLLSTTTTSTTRIINSTNSDKLVEISLSDLPKLRDLYGCTNCNLIRCCYNNVLVSHWCNCWPENHIGYQTITNYLKWINADFITCTTSNGGGSDNGVGCLKCNIVNLNDDDDKTVIPFNDENSEFESKQQQNLYCVHNDDIYSEKKFKIYSLNGDWKTDGLFLIIDNHQIIFNILYGCDVNRLLIALNLLEIEKGTVNILNGFSNCLLAPVTSYMNYNGYKMDHNMNVTCLWYYLSKNEAKKFQIRLPLIAFLPIFFIIDLIQILFKFSLKLFSPEFLTNLKNLTKFLLLSLPLNLRVGNLLENHAEIINRYWSWKHIGSENLIKRLIRYNENIGIYDANDNLIAWCLRQQIGALGVLYVMESFRKNGIGKLIIKTISKIIAEKNGEDVCATVLENNISSRHLFESLGFKICNEMNWIVIEDDIKYKADV